MYNNACLLVLKKLASALVFKMSAIETTPLLQEQQTTESPQSSRKYKKKDFIILSLLGIGFLFKVVRASLWVSVYSLFHNVTCTDQVITNVAYKELIDPGSFAHVILCLQIFFLGLLSCLEFAQLFWGYLRRHYFESTDNAFDQNSVQYEWKKRKS